MEQVEIIVAKGALGRSAIDTLLDSFLRDFAEKNKEYDGQWAEKYGTHYEDENVLMHSFCWCEKDECPYCFYFEDGEKPTVEMKEKFGISDTEVAPNFWYKPLDFKVWWYKYIGRSMQTNKNLTDAEFLAMKSKLLS